MSRQPVFDRLLTIFSALTGSAILEILTTSMLSTALLSLSSSGEATFFASLRWSSSSWSLYSCLYSSMTPLRISTWASVKVTPGRLSWFKQGMMGQQWVKDRLNRRARKWLLSAGDENWTLIKWRTMGVYVMEATKCWKKSTAKMYIPHCLELSHTQEKMNLAIFPEWQAPIAKKYTLECLSVSACLKCRQGGDLELPSQYRSPNQTKNHQQMLKSLLRAHQLPFHLTSLGQAKVTMLSTMTGSSQYSNQKKKKKVLALISSINKLTMPSYI